MLHKEIIHSLKPLVPHITLLHPPSVRGISQSELVLEIRKVSAKHLPATVTLEAAGDFHGNVFYLSIHSPELSALQSRLVELLPRDAQELYSQRGFTPHITLAQVKKPYTLDIQGLSRRIAQEFILPCQFTVNSLSLFTRTAPREYKVETI